MREYQIVEGTKSTLNKVTPKALKALKEMGLFASHESATNALEKIMQMLINVDELKKFVDIVFKHEEIKDYETIDLSEIMDGYNDFFGQLKKS